MSKLEHCKKMLDIALSMLPHVKPGSRERASLDRLVIEYQQEIDLLTQRSEK